jgi:hypothetical protein
MRTQVNPTHFFVILLSLISLFGCGGGGGSGSSSSQSGRVGYAVDDYVISGNVKIFRLGADSVLYETTTGDKGAFYWPESISGPVRIEIAGGFEDFDGLAATTTDRTPFSGPLVALMGAVETQTAPLLVTGVTTGIAAFSANDIGAYTSAINGLPQDIAATFLTSSSDTKTSIGTKLEAAKTIQRTVGFALISSELADDGAINNTQGLSANSISATLAATTSSSPIAAIRDLSLQYCVASKVDKEPSAITLADMQAVTELYCDDSKVATVVGIEALQNLTTLHLNNNDISDPSPLQRLSKLNYLNLADNRLSSIAGLQSGAYSQLALDVEGNCISDIASLRDTAALTFTYYTKYPARQYPGCNRNDANIRRMVAKVGPTGAYILTYAATLNPLAKCQIDWGDGKVETASCDGKAHTLQHQYAVESAAPVNFLINDKIKGTTAFLHGEFKVDFEGKLYTLTNVASSAVYSYGGNLAISPYLTASDGIGNVLTYQFCHKNSDTGTPFCDYSGFSKGGARGGSGLRFVTQGSAFDSTVTSTTAKWHFGGTTGNYCASSSPSNICVNLSPSIAVSGTVTGGHYDVSDGTQTTVTDIAVTFKIFGLTPTVIPQ